MPTLEEIKELVDKCNFESGTYNDVKGDYITGPNGNSLFLPFAGCKDGDYLSLNGESGDFWSGTHQGGYGNYVAYYFRCTNGWGSFTHNLRHIGRSVRPVKDK